jgi:hypothetical protein
LVFLLVVVPWYFAFLTATNICLSSEVINLVKRLDLNINFTFGHEIGVQLLKKSVLNELKLRTNRSSPVWSGIQPLLIRSGQVRFHNWFQPD